ncbi:DUF5685 family protein [Fonticella tunisiensis]|uniref:Uncharacterized protein n=1 Tax=Fonticella tunisiensis TaxID=1096341 RepID=A0A4R7KQE3_9CLOT|nr:DUF5685 family protein [Fonticella tunisiensis]TDT60906.1 hypothetical protein EDD71_11023 [Fonticella tunisiensis]
MFGYVTPLKGELKIKEYDVFRAYYCGLCSEIGRKSYVSKFTLTYDMAFLAVLLSSTYLDKEIGVKSFCPFKMKKVLTMKSNPYIEYAADMNIILSNRKLMDDYNDDKNYVSLVLSRFVNTKNLSDLAAKKVQEVDFYLRELSILEKKRCSSIDEVSHYFACITSEIFSIGDKSRILKVMGYNIGKWVYILDAFDDLIEDIQKKRYNPCIYAFNYKGENPWDFKSRIKENIQFTLIKCLDEMSKSFELLKMKKNGGIIENIVYLGMERRTMAAFEGGCKDEKSLRGFRYKRRRIGGGNKASIQGTCEEISPR